MNHAHVLRHIALLIGLTAGSAQAAVSPEQTVPDGAQATVNAMTLCRKEPAALERLDCYDRLFAPEQSKGFTGALVKARYQGEAWTRAFEQEKQRPDNSTALILSQSAGERPMVIITTPAIGNLPPRPVLMFSCVDNITRMQVALTHPRSENDLNVVLNADNRQLRSRWFIRENGYLLEASRGLSGIDEIKQLIGAKTLRIDIDKDNAGGKLAFNIEGLAKTIGPLRNACHWAGE